MPSLHTELSPRLTRVCLLIGGAIAFLILYFYMASMGKLTPVYADRAGPVVYAQEMLSGNWGLRNWDLTNYAYYNELPFYVIAIKLGGMTVDTMRLVPAFIYALNILLVACVIWKHRTKHSWWMYLPVLAFLILPSNGAWLISLQGATHHVTTTSMLLCMLVVDRRPVAIGWLRIVCLVGISLIAACSDLSFAFLFAVPVLVAILWTHWQNRPLLRESLLSVGAPVTVGVILGRITEDLFALAGFGTAPGTGALSFENFERLGSKLAAEGETWLGLFGAGFFGRPVNLNSIGMLCLSCGAVLWILAVRQPGRTSAAMDRLSISMFACAVAFITIYYSRGSLEFTRFLLPAFLGAVISTSWLLEREGSIGLIRTGATIALAASVVVSVFFFRQNRYLLIGDQYGSWLRANGRVTKRRIDGRFFRLLVRIAH